MINKKRKQAIDLAIVSTFDSKERLKQAIIEELKARDKGEHGIMGNITTTELNCLAYQLGIKA